MEQQDLPVNLYKLQKFLTTPSHISCMAFGHAGHLFVGSDDGALRVYDLSSFKVIKAVRSLGHEVSSIVCVKRAGSELRDAWVACGKRILLFQMDSPKIIQTLEDAVTVIELDETNEDTLNELSLNADKSHLAFSMDSGLVGVVDLATKTVIKMKNKHTSVCGSVKFIPDRPRELVSGGYDTALLHFDLAQEQCLSQRAMEAYSPVSEISMAPPFVMCMAMSTTGVLAAGMADGRLWIGFGGEKIPATAGAKSQKKKSKIWEGLKDDEALLIKVAEGPIVAMAFTDPRTLTISTLLGIITQYHLSYEMKESSVLLKQVWQSECKKIQKVNALVADDKRIIVGGFSAKDQGVIEIWKQAVTPEQLAIEKVSVIEPRNT